MVNYKSFMTSRANTPLTLLTEEIADKTESPYYFAAKQVRP